MKYLHFAYISIKVYSWFCVMSAFQLNFRFDLKVAVKNIIKL